MNATDLIKQFEGCVLTAYQDQALVWTVGWGATGPDVVQGTVWTQAQADARLEEDVAKAKAGVHRQVHVVITSNEESALTSFVFNLGEHALDTSTLLQKLHMGDHIGCAQEFQRWCNVAGKPNRGVLRRRLTEAALFLL